MSDEAAAAPAAEGTQPVEPKPEPKSETHINLHVKGQDQNVVYFKIKRHTPFKKLMEAYCERLSLSMSNVIFLFDGNRLNATQTPNDLDMEDEDEIDACLHQVGGQ
eukprot:CAMPEP_0175901564 /NCGR_PEP_ID=MMETSP0108-20121206/2934_1 /TAXON_ID=195067 ORGANISM="Goniomonas pacifica, Strain CCMP1869" /NCGR_SAMPLE_ID=MMETSP0108 /ASSEMBLY_ACC=CAM_ASM_000204 /LENGTH=105 /DNA_ID=CAMNT_0017223165 /DNA_START=20 /DNA_END=337 /DNA_ORIENTATION=+